MDFSHIDGMGRAQMVDVSEKQPTKRIARASATVEMNKSTADLIKKNALAKGDVLAVANIAGISAAKDTYKTVLMCHNIPLAYCRLKFEFLSNTKLGIYSEVCTTAVTGVEMEALSAVAAASLNVYDMAKSVDKDIIIRDIRLDCKTGGKSGTYTRSKV